MTRYPILLGLLILMVSCAGLTPQRPPGFETYTAVVLAVRPDTAGDAAQAGALHDRLAAALEERRLFASVRAAEEAAAGSGLILEIGITRLRKVPDVQRIALGRMAGSNEIAADVVVKDGATRQVLSRFALAGESPEYPPGSDWPWGSVEAAMDRLAAQLVRIVLKWKQATPPEPR